MNENMIAKLKGFPFAVLFIAYAAYLGYQLYGFHYAPDGQVELHKAQIATSQSEIETLKKKLAVGNKFVKTLELKKVQMQSQMQQLSEYKGALSDGLDVPSMIKLLITEAKKIEMKVEKIEPGRKNQKEYYLEQEFKLDIRGTYQQVILFAQRVSQLQRILRIEAYSMHLVPGSTSTRARNQLIAQLSIRAYQYTLSKEDKINVGGGKL
jgi:Tfp pilus assembly protein PilO